MKRAFKCPLVLAAALIGAVAANSALAQERDLPNVVVERAVPDLTAIEQRLRDRGVSEDRIGIATARIRAAIASGKYPHLERRLYNFLNPDAGEDSNRRRLLAANDRRPDRERPERPDVERPDVNRADDVRPDFDRPANTIAPVAPLVANARSRVLTAPGIAARQ